MSDPTTSRRRFLAGVGAVGAAAFVPAWSVGTAGAQTASGGSLDGPFTLGVASGDPLPSSVVIWTRLAPSPLEPDGGMANRSYRVRWEVARDENFRLVVARGGVAAVPEEGHSVHVDVRGLRPGREYFYRFRVGGEISPVGRTRTAPGPRTLSPLTMAVASCSQYEHGLFTAYRGIADERPDVVVHLGDYIYEYEANDYVAPAGNLRDHVGPETRTLGDYRQRYAQYKTDPDLQAAHAAAPWIVTWDDHEVDNNHAAGIPEDTDEAEGNATPEDFAARRAAAYQAYWENMPLRRFRKPVDTALPLFRGFDMGRTARLSVLDTRQFRTDQPCGDVFGLGCGEESDPSGTILGDEQAAWLEDRLVTSNARWNVVPQQIFLASLDFNPGENSGGYNDGWDGYRASRDRLFGFVDDQHVDNFVVLTGDVHSTWMNDLRRDFERPELPVIGSELVCTSIASEGDGTDDSWLDAVPVLRDENPHVVYTNRLRGYLNVRFDRDVCTADVRAIPGGITTPDQPIETIASFVIEDGRPGLQTP
ncbi:MAG: alkaline phosphatase D family protein [Actinomycetota bacterium]